MLLTIKHFYTQGKGDHIDASNKVENNHVFWGENRRTIYRQ